MVLTPIRIAFRASSLNFSSFAATLVSPHGNRFSLVGMGGSKPYYTLIRTPHFNFCWLTSIRVGRSAAHLYSSWTQQPITDLVTLRVFRNDAVVLCGIDREQIDRFMLFRIEWFSDREQRLDTGRCERRVKAGERALQSVDQCRNSLAIFRPRFPL